LRILVEAGVLGALELCVEASLRGEAALMLQLLKPCCVRVDGHHRSAHDSKVNLLSAISFARTQPDLGCIELLVSHLALAVKHRAVHL